MKNIITFLCVFFLCIGCSPKFYPEIKLTYEYKIKKKYDEHNKLFIKMDKELANTNHIMYIYMPDYAVFTTSTVGFIYDVDNKVYYEIIFDEMSLIKIKKLNSCPKSTYEAFILENYLKGNYDYLKGLSKKLITSKGITNNSIYDIDLKNKIYKNFVFGNFPFLDGKPFDGNNIESW